MPMSTNRRLPEAATGIPAWQHKQAAYVPAYAAPVSAAEQQDRLALLAAGMEPPDVLAAIGTALQVETP